MKYWCRIWGRGKRVDERAVNRYGNANARAVLEYFWVLDYVPAVLGGGSLFRFFLLSSVSSLEAGNAKRVAGKRKRALARSCGRCVYATKGCA